MLFTWRRDATSTGTLRQFWIAAELDSLSSSLLFARVHCQLMRCTLVGILPRKKCWLMSDQEEEGFALFCYQVQNSSCDLGTLCCNVTCNCLMTRCLAVPQVGAFINMAGIVLFVVVQWQILP